MITQPNQRVSNKEKQTSEWYIQNAEYIIDSCTAKSNKVLTKKFLDITNNRIDEEYFKYILKQYSLDGADQKDILAKIRNIDIVTPIKEKYMGEFINMFQNYQVYNNDPDTVLRRNNDIATKVSDIVIQEVINILNASENVDTNAESTPDIDVEKEVKKAIEGWNDTEAIETQHHLDFLNDLIQARSKYIQAYFYWFACEETYTYREVHDNDVDMKVISPLEYYRYNSGARYVEDDPMGVRKYKINIYDVVDKFRNDLSAEDIKYIKTCYRITDSEETPIVMLQSLVDYGARNKVNGSTVLETLTERGDNTIDVYHYVWKTLIKQGILNYIALDGTKSQTIVDNDYVFEPAKGDIDIEWEWVHQVWEGYRFGDKFAGVYIKPRPIPVQREYFNNYSICKLPYNGICGLLFENDRNPIPYRLLDYTILYRIYTLQEERAINRFKSLLLFPETILADTAQMTTKERLDIATTDGFLPFDDSEAGANALQSIKEVANTALINYLQMLGSKKADIKAEAFEIANMNDARFGNIAPRAGKATTEYAFSQAMTGSVLSLEVFNLFRETDYAANLDYSKIAWFDGKQGSYVDPNTGDIRTVKIVGSESLSRNVGIFIRSSKDVESQLAELKSIAFNMSQNGNGEFALHAVTNNNVFDLKAKIQESIISEREHAAKMQEYQSTLASQQAEQAASLSAQEHQQKMELESARAEGMIRVAEIEQETAIEVTAMKLTVDTNGNGHIDKDEANARTNRIPMGERFNTPRY